MAAPQEGKPASFVSSALSYLNLKDLKRMRQARQLHVSPLAHHLEVTIASTISELKQSVRLLFGIRGEFLDS